jgi:hypothetical protein
LSVFMLKGHLFRANSCCRQRDDAQLVKRMLKFIENYRFFDFIRS